MDKRRLLAKIPSIFQQDSEVEVGPGDDCAVLDFGLDKFRLLAVDQLVSDIHYVKAATSPEEIATKLVSRNVSDIAAMGGMPAQALLAMTLTSDSWKRKGWVDGFLAAIAIEAKRWNMSVCGGDISSTTSETDSFSLTITGWVEKDRLTKRSDAQHGDILYATGEFGDSFHSGHHLNFTPRLNEARFLAKSFAHAMIDVSDGLQLDAARIAEMSKLNLEIDIDAIPLRGKATIEQALSDGEDYELLFSVSSQKSSKLEKIWPFEGLKLTRIGIFYKDSNQPFNASAGNRQQQNENGFIHFR
jgi:thiamine-monophosphate kinase